MFVVKVVSNRDAPFTKSYVICIPTRNNVANNPSSITDVIRHVYGESAESLPWEEPNVQYEYTPRDHANGNIALSYGLLVNVGRIV